MLLTEMTSRKSSENKSRSYRQCVENLRGQPKLKLCTDFNMVEIDSRPQTIHNVYKSTFGNEDIVNNW